jgi:hypothetical protein
MANNVKELVTKLRPTLSLARYGKIFTDTTDFSNIDHGDVIKINNLHYVVIRDEVERSYGIEDPKYWVKRCVCLENGERYIIKLVFYENFILNLGVLKIKCYRSPEKEARILNLVKNDKRFMQGMPFKDEKGNSVRIIEIVIGKKLDDYIAKIEADHRTYFFECFPEILEKYIYACEAINFLHENNEKHGDIRRDHLWIEYKTGDYVWIDFDYTFDFYENPFGLDIFGLGNLLACYLGKGEISNIDLEKMSQTKELDFNITKDDYSLLYSNRVYNLKQIYPYIPERLNEILMHFTVGSEVFYETVDEFLLDLNKCLHELKK